MVLGGDEVDGNTLSAESSTSTNSMDVVLSVGGQVEVDDQRNLLDIDTSGKQIGSDEDSRRTGSESLHNDISLRLLGLTVHGGDGEVSLGQSLGQVVDLSSGVAENDGLRNVDGLVEIAQNLKLVGLLLNINVELLDTFKGQLILLDKNSDGVSHELAGDVEDLSGHGGRQQNGLGGLGEGGEDIVDGVLELSRKHLIGLIKDEHLDEVGLEDSSLNHIVDSTGGSDNDVDTLLDDSDVLGDGGTTNAGVALNLHVLAKGKDNLLDLVGQLSSGGNDQSLGLLNLLVNVLQSRDREGGSLTSTRLGLGKDIVTLDDGQDGSLLNGGRVLKTVTVDTSEQLVLESKVVERGNNLVVVGGDLGRIDVGESVGHFVFNWCFLSNIPCCTNVYVFKS